MRSFARLFLAASAVFTFSVSAATYQKRHKEFYAARGLALTSIPQGISMGEAEEISAKAPKPVLHRVIFERGKRGGKDFVRFSIVRNTTLSDEQIAYGFKGCSSVIPDAHLQNGVVPSAYSSFSNIRAIKPGSLVAERLRLIYLRLTAKNELVGRIDNVDPGFRSGSSTWVGSSMTEVAFFKVASLKSVTADTTSTSTPLCSSITQDMLWRKIIPTPPLKPYPRLRSSDG